MHNYVALLKRIRQIRHSLNEEGLNPHQLFLSVRFMSVAIEVIGRWMVGGVTQDVYYT